MSTRATIHFHYGSQKDPAAIIYRHNDGYPDGLGKDLLDFVSEVKRDLKDQRLDDATYLAAKWVVWDALRHAAMENEEAIQYPKQKLKQSPLNFISVGVCLEDPGDTEYRYHVQCNGFPTITCETSKGKSVPMPS